MRFLYLALLLAATPVLAPHALAQTAEETVRGFYGDPPFDFFEPGNWRELTGPALATVKKNAEAPGGEVGCLDFMPTVDGQDYDAAEIARTLTLTDEGGGSVLATFKMFGEDRRLHWSMQKEKGAWKVADLASETGDWRLGALCSQ